MGCCTPAVEQAGARQKHRASANGTDSTTARSGRFQPAHCFHADFVLLDRIATSDQQRINSSADLPESLVRLEPYSAIRAQRSVMGYANNFNRIDWPRARMLPAMDVGRAGENLERT